MPIINLKLNFPVEDEKALAAEFSKANAAIFDKPESAFLVFVSHVPSLIFAGSFEKAFFIHVVSSAAIFNWTSLI